MRKLLGLTCFVLAVLLVHGLPAVRGQTKKIEIVFTPKSPNTEVKFGPTDVKIAAEAWYAEFKSDPDGARKKYDKKVIEITGVVKRIGEDFSNQRLTVEADKSGATFNCYTVDRKPWLKVMPGATVTVKGIVPAAGALADLGSVQILNAGENKTLTLTADNLAMDVAKNRAEAVQKYDKKWCHLSGEVIESKGVPTGWEVKLKSDIPIVCVTGTFGQSDPMETLKKGAKAKLFGQLIVVENDKKVYLINSLVTEPRPAK